MKGGFLNQKRTASSGSGSSRGPSRVNASANGTRGFASVQAHIGVPFLLQQCKEKLPPEWHKRVQHLQGLASELHALVNAEGMHLAERAQRILEIVQKIDHGLGCVLQAGKNVEMKGMCTKWMEDPSLVVKAMGDFHVVQQLRSLGLHIDIRAIAAGAVAPYPSLARPQAELPTARSTPNPAPGAPGTPDTFRTVLRVAHHLFAPSYSFLEGSVGPDGKQISFSPEDKEALEKLRAEPALITLALEKWAFDGVSCKDVQLGENAAQDYLVQLLHSDHSPVVSKQLHALLSSKYAANAFGKCLQTKSLPVLEVAVQLLRRIVGGPKELVKTDDPWRGVAWEQGLRPFPVFISEAWLPNLIACLQASTSAHALWSSNIASQKNLPPSARHKQAEEGARRVGQLIKAVNDCFDFAVNNVGSADISKQPPPKGSPPSLECDATRWPDALITAHAGMNFKAMQTFHAKRMEFLASLRPYAPYGGHLAFKAKGAAQALGSVLDSVPITSLVLSHSPRDLEVLASLLASASPGDRAALLKANDGFVDTLSKMVLLWAEALCIQTLMDFDKASKSRRSGCEYEVMMEEEQAGFDMMVGNLWRLRCENNHKPQNVLESLSEILKIICSTSPSTLPLDHFQNVTLIQRLKRLVEGKEMACAWLQRQEVMQPAMKKAKSVLIHFKKEFLNFQRTNSRGKAPRTREEVAAAVAEAKASVQASASAAIDIRRSHPGHRAVVDEVEKAVWAEVERLTQMMEARRKAASQEGRSLAQVEVDMVAMTAHQAALRAIEAAQAKEEALAISGEGPGSPKIAIAVAVNEVKEAVDFFLQEGWEQQGPLAGAATEAAKNSAEAAFALACKADKLGQEAQALDPSPKDQKKIATAISDAQGAADGAAETVIRLLADAKSDEVLQEMASSADVYKGIADYAVSTLESHLKRLRESKKAAAMKDAKQEEDKKGCAASSTTAAAQGPDKSEAAAANGGEGRSAAAEKVQQQQQQQQQQRREKQEGEKGQQQKAEKPLHVCIGCLATGVSFKKCSVCHGRYCSVQCQKNYWTEHRKVCKRP